MIKPIIALIALSFITGCGFKHSTMNIHSSQSLSQNFCYTNSYGDIARTPNYDQAFYWCSRSSNENIASGHVMLAELYMLGNYVEQDFTEAHTLYQRAAKQNHPHAQFMLFKINRLGLGMNKNEDEAIYWLNRANKNGSEYAKKHISR